MLLNDLYMIIGTPTTQESEWVLFAVAGVILLFYIYTFIRCVMGLLGMFVK